MTTVQVATGTFTQTIFPSDTTTTTMDPFKLGDNLFNSKIEIGNAVAGSKSESKEQVVNSASEANVVQKEEEEEVVSPTGVQGPTSDKDGDKHVSSHLDGHLSDKGSDDHAGEKSPPSDGQDGRTRSNRQRRRIAGGVISLPTTSKTLLSKSSTGSLLNAFQAGGDTQGSSSSAMETTDSIAHEYEYEQHDHPSDTTTTRKTTKMTTSKRTIITSRGGGGGEEETAVSRTTKNDDIVTKAIIADAELDVTASEVSSLMTKSPPEESHETRMFEQEVGTESADRDDTSV